MPKEGVKCRVGTGPLGPEPRGVWGGAAMGYNEEGPDCWRPVLQPPKPPGTPPGWPPASPPRTLQPKHRFTHRLQGGGLASLRVTSACLVVVTAALAGAHSPPLSVLAGRAGPSGCWGRSPVPPAASGRRGASFFTPRLAGVL